MVASWGLATVSQQELWRLLHLFIFLCLAAVSFLTTLKNLKVQASQSAGGEEHKGKTAETFFSFVFSVIKHQSICVLKLCAVFAFYTCDSQNCSSLTTRLIQTDGNCRLDETLGGVPFLPSSPPPFSTSTIEIVHWCKTCWAGVSVCLPSLPRGSTTLNIAPPPPSPSVSPIPPSLPRSFS